MSFFLLIHVEIARIFRTRLTWLFVVLTAVSPLFGFTIFKLNGAETAGTQMIINPLITGAIGSAILSALFTLLELDRVNKYRVSALTNAVASPAALHIAKMAAIFSVALLAAFVTILAYLPYTMVKMESFADPLLYVSSYALFMIPAMCFGSLFAAIFHQVFRRADISFVMVLACVLLSFHFFSSGDILLTWVITNIPVFSDGFGNARPLRMGLYNRLFWLMFLTGAWILSLLFTEKYEKGIIGSLVCNSKKWYLPALGTLLLLLSMNHYRNQPFFNKAPLEIDWSGLDSVNEANAGFNIISAAAHVIPNFNRGTLSGEIAYVFGTPETDTPKIGAPSIGADSSGGIMKMNINCGYSIYRMTADGAPIEFTDLANDQFYTKIIEFAVPEGIKELKVAYGGYPMLWGASKLGFLGVEISRRNVELRVSSLIPDMRLTETRTEVSVVLPENFTPLPSSLIPTVSGGIDNGDGTKTWVITHPSVDYIEIFSADYAGRTVSAGSITAEFFYHRNFHDLLEENGIDEVLSAVINYCTGHYGPLHFLKDNYLRLIMTSAYNFGGGAVQGLSDMSETTFSIYSLSDPWKGATGREILAHEIIHQWWGLNRVIWDEFNDFPAWTSEGLTVYSTYRLYKEKYGEEYGRINYVDKWKQAVEEMNRNFYRRRPEYLEILPQHFRDIISAGERGVLRYNYMPLLIHRAAELAGGDEAMDGILSDLAQSNNYENLTFQEFLAACGLSIEDLL
ncbi:MAG: hypothetical protein FWH38_02015 [Treponema sp.]|nr:hypothetical protein [Treponema sp.]